MNKTITDIIPPSRRRAMEQGANGGTGFSSYAPPPPPPRPLSDRPLPSPGGRRRFPVGTAAIVILIVLASVGAMYYFSGATVKITPTSNSVYVSSDFTATSQGGDLPFEVITVDKTAGSPVPAESTETANDPASGKITIYNAQATPQTLIKNTRFQTAAGLIFRVHDSVTVPAGTAAAPGSLQTTVYADAGGEQYNIGPTTFTIPGLQGSKAFDLVTAKSTDSMSGGFSGTRASVSQATRDAQDTKNRATLETSLKEAINAAIPAGYVLVPGSSYTAYEPAPDAASKDSQSVTVSTKGTVTAVVFPQAALAKAIAYKVVGSYAGQPISVPDVSGLTLKPATEGAPAADAPTYSFNLTGNTTLVWNVDPTRVAGAVAGKSRAAAENILSGFPEVSTATLVLRPFWSHSFPNDPSSIKVSTSSPEK